MPRGIPNTDPAMYCIHPCVKRGLPCWEVIVRRWGKYHRKYFGHGAHGGEAGALRKAQAWRDEIVERYPPMTKRDRRSILQSNNKSGVAGVRLDRRTAIHYWIAETRFADGRKMCRRFRVDILGSEQAKQRAIEERARQLEQVTGLHLWLAPPEVVAKFEERLADN
jgi:hypothetical protein